jgi:hypothetical protein
LRAAIDWSYDLLDELERNVLDRCAVFVGGFDLAAIAAVAVSLEIDEIEVAGCIGSLVAKSLVERGEDDRGSRYRLLEMIRQYLAERLEDGGAATEARDLHARHYLAFAKHRFAAANSTAAWDAINDLDREVANLAAAGRWLIDRGRSAELLEFFADVPFVDSTALPAAVLDALGRTAADCIAVNESPTHRGAREACFVAAMRHFFDGDTTAYRRYSEVGNTIPGPPSARMTLLASSVAMIIEGDVEKATQIAKDAIEIARVNGSREELAFTLGFIAVFEQLIHPDDALRHALEGVALARRCGSPIALL